MNTIKPHRDHGFDNIRGLLICFVVFAHLLEIRAPFPGSETMYQIIYSFHMPVFLFICGWFAHFDRVRLLGDLLLPYFLLQIIYILFQRWLYGADLVMQFTTPYWLLWFLLALFFYHLMLPLYDVASPKARLGILAGSVVIALLAGYDDSIGYYLTLSRFLTFQPFFLLGYYLRHTEGKPIHNGHRILICCPLVICLVALCLGSFENHMLYGSYSYRAGLYHIGIRFFLGFMAFLWILFFHYILRSVLDRRLPILGCLGKHSFSIFILHGFLVKFIGYRCPQIMESPIVFLLITAIILLVTGNPITDAIFRRLMPGFWIHELLAPQPPKES